MPEPARRSLQIYLSLQIVLLAIFYWPFLCGQRAFYYEDSTQFFEPLCTYIGNALRSGHWPLWNPYNYCGMSQVAISSPSVFYPLNAFFALQPFSNALAAIMLISQSVCGLGAYLLIEELGWGFLPAALCGSIMALSGYMFSLSTNYTLVTSACWLPLSLWLVLKIHRSAMQRWTVFQALCIFMLVTAGRPEIAAPSLAGILSLSLFLFFFQPHPEGRERLFSQFKALLLGGLLSMPVILPSLEWLPLSRRSEGLNHVETLMFSANWYDLIGMFASQPLGDLQLRGSLFRKLVEPNNIGPYFNSSFVGSLPILLAVIGLSNSGGKLKMLSICGLAAVTIAALGTNFPLMDQLVDHVSSLSILRFPSKYLFFTTLFIALFAARGLRAFLSRQLNAAPAMVLTAGIGLTGLILGLLSHPVLPFIATMATTEDLALKGQHMIGWSLLCWSLIALVIGIVIHNWKTERRTQVAGGLVLVSAGCLLFHAFLNAHTGATASYYSTGSALASDLSLLAGQDHLSGGDRRYIGLYLQQFTVPPGANSPDALKTTINTYQYSRQILRPFTNMDFDWQSSYGFEGSMVGEYYYLLLNTYFKSTQALPSFTGQEEPLPQTKTDLPLSRLLRLTATRYAVTQVYRRLPEIYVRDRRPQPVPQLDPQYFVPVQDNLALNYRIYRIKDSLPAAYLSYAWNNLESRDKVIQSIFDEHCDFDPGKLTLLEKYPNPAAKVAFNLELDPVTVVSSAPEHLVIKANAKSRGIVVLAHQHYPGWVAHVDGEPADILRCNGFMQGVAVSDGAHTITLDYDPSSLRYGFLLAGIAIVWSALLLFGNSLSLPLLHKQGKPSN